MIIGPGARIRFALLFRSPLVAKNVIHQALETNSGPLNIETCRVKGRWPTNLMFVHSENCRPSGTKRIPGHKGYPNGPGGKSYQYTSKKRSTEVRPQAWAGHADAEGMETIDTWSCGPECLVDRLNDQSGDRPATLTGRASPDVIYDNPSLVKKPGLFGVSGSSFVYADSGGAARYYVQVKSENEALDWFRRLITPPTGTLFER